MQLLAKHSCQKSKEYRTFTAFTRLQSIVVARHSVRTDRANVNQVIADDDGKRIFTWLGLNDLTVTDRPGVRYILNEVNCSGT